MEDSWIKHYWRPAIAWQYLIVCLFDFIIAPTLTGVLSYYTKTPYMPWEPLTLKESGFYHMAMGAIIGVSAWTRGQEKIRNIFGKNSEISTETTTTSQTPVR